MLLFQAKTLLVNSLDNAILVAANVGTVIPLLTTTMSETSAPYFLFPPVPVVE